MSLEAGSILGLGMVSFLFYLFSLRDFDSWISSVWSDFWISMSLFTEVGMVSVIRRFLADAVVSSELLSLLDVFVIINIILIIGAVFFLFIKNILFVMSVFQAKRDELKYD